ncbi:MAG TPA: DUF4864 domain-containing protein [Candidatus Acidoferrales bacterium]|nr:DUF4864 domain-containing protein [Candidatus Acidoferrales bacterium]
MRRLIILFISAGLTFSLTAAWLSHIANPLSTAEVDAQAADVVRAHFAALQRGDFRTAYLQFSTRYRDAMPFDSFHDMVIAHWSLFQQRRIILLPQQQTDDRVVLETDFTDSSGTDVVAEFTLIRSDDRWWIDNVHWDHGLTHHLIRI